MHDNSNLDIDNAFGNQSREMEQGMKQTNISRSTSHIENVHFLYALLSLLFFKVLLR